MSMFEAGSMRVKFDEPVLDNVLHSKTGVVGSHMRTIGIKILTGARAMAPVTTGALKRSLKMKHTRLVRSQKIQVGSNLRYAYVAHEGSKPHVIVPTQGRVLHFKVHGRVVNTRIVHHPGTRGTPYLTVPMRIAVHR